MSRCLSSGSLSNSTNSQLTDTDGEDSGSGKKLQNRDDEALMIIATEGQMRRSQLEDEGIV